MAATRGRGWQCGSRCLWRNILLIKVKHMLRVVGWSFSALRGPFGRNLFKDIKQQPPFRQKLVS